MNGFIRTIGWIFLAATLLASELACNKDAFLTKKTSSTLVVPSTLSDFQALMDNTKVFNLVPTLGENSADNYFISDTIWMNLDTREHNAYVWAKDIYGGQGGQLDWNIPYEQVFYANVVLDGLKGIKTTGDSVAQWNALEGAALFSRAFAFYNVAQLFATIYDSTTASSDLGIPLRTNSGINTLSARSTVQATYDQILSDLHSAEAYLPTGLPGNTQNRPVRSAALALLARVYLSMRNYAMARVCADSALQGFPASQLMDFNGLDTSTSGAPVGMFNTETIYQASFLGAPSTTPYFTELTSAYSTTWIDSTLYASYDVNDLRRLVFYRVRNGGRPYLRPSYTGGPYPFGGLAVDEMLLIRAEGAARLGDIVSAGNDINTLLQKRWRQGTFTGYTFGSQKEALDTVLLERRKELAFRGMRWTDLRRLNKDGTRAITLTRKLFGITYPLAPNSLNYVLPIPPDVLNLNDLIIQNPRQ